MERAMTVTTTKIVLAVAFLLSVSAPVLADVGQPAADDQVQKATEAVAAVQQRLDQLKEVAASGAVPGRRVQEAEIDLAEARVSLAALEGKQQAVLDGLTSLVEQLQRRWEQVQQLEESGAIPKRTALRTRIDLAEARVRLELQTLADVRRQELIGLEEGAKLGAVPQRAVDEARQALDLARGRIRLVQAPAAGARSKEKTDTSDAIKELLKQRLATVVEIDKLVQTAYRSGEAGVDQVHQARAALLSAQLDLAETKDEQIKVHLDLVRQAEEWSKVVAEMAKAQQATAIDVLKAKAHLLEAQIALEKARAAK